MVEPQTYSPIRGWPYTRKASYIGEIRDWQGEYETNTDVIEAEVQSIIPEDITLAVMITTSTTPVENAAAYNAVYAHAKTLSPTDTDRISIRVPHGLYDFGATGCTADTDWIDIVGDQMAVRGDWSLRPDFDDVTRAGVRFIADPGVVALTITANDAVIRGVDTAHSTPGAGYTCVRSGSSVLDRGITLLGCSFTDDGINFATHGTYKVFECHSEKGFSGSAMGQFHRCSAAGGRSFDVLNGAVNLYADSCLIDYEAGGTLDAVLYGAVFNDCRFFGDNVFGMNVADSGADNPSTKFKDCHFNCDSVGGVVDYYNLAKFDGCDFNLTAPLLVGVNGRVAHGILVCTGANAHAVYLSSGSILQGDILINDGANGVAGDPSPGTIQEIVGCSIKSTGAAINSTVPYAGSNTLNGTWVGKGDLTGVDHIDMSLTPASTVHTPGRLRWNPVDNTLDIDSDIDGVSIQVNQETLIKVYNDTGDLIPDGSVVYSVGVFGERPSVAMALSDSHETAPRDIAIATMDIPDGTYGMCVELVGKVRGLDTSGLALGEIWLSDTIPGAVTSTKPAFPSYQSSVGGCLKVDGADGVIQARLDGNNPLVTVLNAWNGCIRETFEFPITSNGSVITGTLQRVGGGDLTLIFTDGLSTFDCTPPATIALTPGTDTNPGNNFVYILKSTKALTLSTAGWPVEEHAKISDSFLKSAATTQTDNAITNQFHNNHVQNVDGIGLVQEIADNLRDSASYISPGIDLTVDIQAGPTPDDVYIALTSGKVRQLRLQTFGAFDLEAAGNILVINDSVSPFKPIANLNAILLDAAGASFNGNGFSLVVGVVCNSRSEPNQVFINLPSDSYSTPSDALADSQKFANYTAPAAFGGKAILAWKIDFELNIPGNAWTLLGTTDLRGSPFSNAAGGGGPGGGGATSWTALTDTPSSFIGQGGKPVVVGLGETALEFGPILNLENGAGANTVQTANSSNVVASEGSTALGFDHDLSNVGSDYGAAMGRGHTILSSYATGLGFNCTLANQYALAGGDSSSNSGRFSIIWGQSVSNAAPHSFGVGQAVNMAPAASHSVAAGDAHDVDNLCTLTVGGKNNNYADYSVVHGHYAKAEWLGSHVFSGGTLSGTIRGRNQAATAPLIRLTTDATQVPMYLDGSSAELVLENNAHYVARLHLIAASSLGVKYWNIGAAFYAFGGVAQIANTSLGDVPDPVGSTIGLSAGLGVSGLNARVLITGRAAENWEWSGHLTVAKTYGAYDPE